MSILRLGESPDGDGDPIGAGGCWITRSFDTPRRQRGLGGAAGASLAAGQSGTIDGAWGSSAALAAAALAADTPGTLLVVLPNPSDVEPWAHDLTSFMGVRPAVFEAWEGWPVPSNRGKLDSTSTARLRLLQQLAADPPRVVVASIAAVCQPVPQRADLAARGRTIAPAK